MLDLEGVEEDDNKDGSEDEVEDLAYDTDDDINELDALSGEEKATFLEVMVAVKEAVTKIRMLPFMHMLLPFLHNTTGSNCHSQSSTQLQSHCQHGAVFARPTSSSPI
jgi:hypothetical protein